MNQAGAIPEFSPREHRLFQGYLAPASFVLRYGINIMNKYSTLENVSFYGRTSRIEGSDAVYFNWSGSGFAFNFLGTTACCTLLGGVNGEQPPEAHSRGYIGVYVDGNPFEIARFAVDSSQRKYTLAEGLPYGEHTVFVVKETEVAYGRVALLSVSCDGELLPPPKLPEMKIEFIGDSITCGYGNICSTASAEFVTAEENFSQTYAAVAAWLLGAQVSVVAASGNGFFHDYGCNTCNLIPELYSYTDKFLHEHCGIALQKWDFDSDKCDIIVVKLGQNDAQYCCGADLEEAERTPEIITERRFEFCETATRFFNEISEKRKNTPILLIFETDMYLKNELVEAARKSKADIHTLEFVNKRDYESVGANGHYSVYTHARVGRLVADKIKEILC